MRDKIYYVTEKKPRIISMQIYMQMIKNTML